MNDKTIIRATDNIISFQDDYGVYANFDVLDADKTADGLFVQLLKQIEKDPQRELWSTVHDMIYERGVTYVLLDRSRKNEYVVLDKAVLLALCMTHMSEEMQEECLNK